MKDAYVFQVTDQRLMDILRRKVKLNQPYAGIFVKRDDENQAEVVADMKELYSIGTFAQIVELQDLGSRLRMVTMLIVLIMIKPGVFRF